MMNVRDERLAILLFFCLWTSWMNVGVGMAEEAITQPESHRSEYTIGVDDLLEINILQPDKLSATVTVAPDGSITFPYIGTVYVKGMTLAQIEQQIQSKLADGYMKYPVVSVALKESRSRKFFVYGEVIKPGAYPLEENTTVLRAISIAGGFTKFGSSSRVKVLRQRKDPPGYETIKVDIKTVMEGNSDQDLVIQPGDVVVISEGIL